MKHENRKPGTRKGFAALVALVLILCVTIGGTLAWITAQTGEVVNTFTPAKVETTITEDVTQNNKDDIKVKNDGDIPAYVRVAVVANWVDSKNNVVPGTFTLPATADGWVLASDGFYYYTQPVPAGKSTTELFATPIEEIGGPTDAHLQVTILAEAIQSTPANAVTEAWGVNPSTLKPTTNS